MVLLDGRMVVHVVAAEIGEGAGREPDAVEPPLVEAVARRLHRGMGDAGIGKLGEQLVQLDRIGRGELTVVVAAGRHDAGGADAGRRVSRLLPDLAGEGGDRGLAAGAGDGDHGFRLARIKPRRDPREHKPGIFDGNHRRWRRPSAAPLAATMATAPRPAASAAKLAPSALDPATATKIAPGCDLARIRGHSGDLGVGENAVGGQDTG